ncbi:MAG: hypothetical protein IJ881_01355 [Neisseriaceae bacterium]|nr:hypothetical protein [Neisseriaceae bacterium]MBR3425914.1 hypothetical protein [Neisseriaceae bacterium]
MTFQELQAALGRVLMNKKYDDSYEECCYGLLHGVWQYAIERNLDQTPDELAKNLFEGHLIDRRYVSEEEWEQALPSALFADLHYACLSFKH